MTRGMSVWIEKFRFRSLLGSSLCGRLSPLFLCPSSSFFPLKRNSTMISLTPSTRSWGCLSYAKTEQQWQEPINPFSLVAPELSLISERLRSMVGAEFSDLSAAAGYFFRSDVEGKKMCPTVLLLMAKSFDLIPNDSIKQHGGVDLREKQYCLAEITEIIHVASLIHDDVLDEANTRRGIGPLNFVKGNKLAVLTGDFLLFRAFGALAFLKNPEAVSLIATALEDLVAGETMQMTATLENRCSMEFYMQKTYNKTASLISNSCKAMALLSGQNKEVAELAFEYGKNLGLAYQLIDDILDFTGSSVSLGKASLSDIKNGIITAPMLFAMEEFPQLREIVKNGFEDPASLDDALEYLGRSNGIQRTSRLALKHSELATVAVNSLPKTVDEDAMRARGGLTGLTQIILSRKK